MSRSATVSREASDFERVVDDAISRALASQADGLRGLLGAVGGADPVTATVALESLESGDGPLAPAARAILEEARSARPRSPSTLPVPHPLDYAWMFTTDTDYMLLERIARATVTGDLIAHLGTPSLHALALAELPERRHILLDRDPRRIADANRARAGSAIECDLLRGRPKLEGAAMAIADPPWYPQHATGFIAAAAHVLEEGAQLLLAAPSALTRPGIADENQALVDCSIQSGLKPGSRERGALRYLTPPFERAAMRAAGLPGIPDDWRRADIWTMRAGPARRVADPEPTTDCWERHEIDEIPMMVRRDAPACGVQLLDTLVEGDVLASVSARAPERETAALWTSCNRVFCSSEPAMLAELLDRIGRAQAILPAQKQAAEHLRNIVAAERKEHQLPS